MVTLPPFGFRGGSFRLSVGCALESIGSRYPYIEGQRLNYHYRHVGTVTYRIAVMTVFSELRDYFCSVMVAMVRIRTLNVVHLPSLGSAVAKL